MATSKDFEKLWKRYQDEVQSTGKSIVTYCQENGIVYAQFEKWYKKRVNPTEKNPSIVPIEVTDIPSEVEAPRHESPRNPNQDPMWIRPVVGYGTSGLHQPDKQPAGYHQESA